MTGPDGDALHAAMLDGDFDGMRRIAGDSPRLPIGDEMMLDAVGEAPDTVVLWLIARGAPVRLAVDDGFPLVHLALDRRTPPGGAEVTVHPVLDALLEAGADADERGLNDWTPLHKAAVRGDLKACRILLARGADRRARTRIDDRATPEEEARRLGQTAAADLIREAGPDGTAP